MSARIAVRVHPGARRAGLQGWRDDGALRIAVAAPPEGGRANRALLELLSDVLGVRRSALTLVRGASARDKVVDVRGLEAAELRRRIAVALREQEGGASD
ncbi:MAG: hypothetical protein A2W00_00375 [Candidatus Eisenbacteria bacterium RBG_16_71_46]|nr:MAG: hypothetical protein A2W00_00375 [Candidatus Eisenbacteria bacterium RBG_16_71_46]